MINQNTYQYISTAATTVIGSATNRRVALAAIFINKTLTGTLTVKAGATTIGVFAIGTPVGIYWHTTNTTEIFDFQIVTSAGDDVTVVYNNL